MFKVLVNKKFRFAISFFFPPSPACILLSVPSKWPPEVIHQGNEPVGVTWHSNKLRNNEYSQGLTCVWLYVPRHWPAAVETSFLLALLLTHHCNFQCAQWQPCVGLVSPVLWVCLRCGGRWRASQVLRVRESCLWMGGGRCWRRARGDAADPNIFRTGRRGCPWCLALWCCEPGQGWVCVFCVARAIFCRSFFVVRSEGDVCELKLGPTVSSLNGLLVAKLRLVILVCTKEIQNWVA